MQGQIIVSSVEKEEAPGTLHLWTAMGSTVEIREAKLVGKERTRGGENRAVGIMHEFIP